MLRAALLMFCASPQTAARESCCESGAGRSAPGAARGCAVVGAVDGARAADRHVRPLPPRRPLHVWLRGGAPLLLGGGQRLLRPAGRGVVERGDGKRAARLQAPGGRVRQRLNSGCATASWGHVCRRKRTNQRLHLPVDPDKFNVLSPEIVGRAAPRVHIRLRGRGRRRAGAH